VAPELWPQVDRILEAALDLPPGDREAFAAAECRGDAALLHEVRTMLRSCADSEELFEAPVPEPGRRLGAYRILRELGRGGMGMVYLAERDDDQFQKQVAIKVVASTLGLSELVRRFRGERRILALLEHVNIARLLDAGATPAGLRYIVMEYVDGVPIDRYCSERNLDLTARLRLFQQACAGVQWAHRYLIVHRDIKPGNVLVTAEGVPKLLDFGIAKFLSAESGTRTLLNPMTPEYASPEQVRGLPLSTASDIYSLGVLLYELVTGGRPYQVSGKPLDQVLQTVCAQEPAPPRSPAADLDAIVLKALRKDPAERYGSAGELSADIGRFTAGQPVLAQPPRAAYVVRKFIGRHRGAVAAGAAAVLALAAAGALILFEWRVATQRFNDVRRLAHFVIFDMHDAIAPLPGSTPARRLLVAHALQYLDSLAAGAPRDESLRREMGLAYLRIADVSGNPHIANLGNSEEALRGYRRGLALLEPLFEKHAGDDQLDSAVLRGYQGLNNVYGQLRRSAEALQTAQSMLRVCRELTARVTSDTNRERLAIAWFGLAQSAYLAGHFDEVLDRYQQATAIFEDLLKKEPGNLGRQRNVALGHKYIAGNLVDHGGDLESAEFHLNRAEQLDAARAAGHPQDRQAKLDLSFDYSQDAGFQLNRKKDPPKALDLFQKTLALREELAAADPQDAQAQQRLVFVENLLALTLLEMKRPSEADPHASRALRLSQQLYAREESPLNREQLARAYQVLGQAEEGIGHRQPACTALLQARTLAMRNQQEGKAGHEEEDILNEVQKSLPACRK